MTLPERIDFRLSLLVYRWQQGQAPANLAGQLRRVADIDNRRRLRSAATASLLAPATKHVTIEDRAFPVAAANSRSNLMSSVTSPSTLPIFERRLKTELFGRSFGAS